MKFYFPDSQDQIDPTFNFISEEREPLRVRQRDDLYAHEVFRKPPYQGLLVSMAMIDGMGGPSRYSAQQRQRFYRGGVRDFFRLDAAGGARITTLGDCGAFSYVNEDKPPYSAGQVLDFYARSGFDEGVSVDHVIPVYEDVGERSIDRKWRERYKLTLKLAAKFLDLHREGGYGFVPIGVAQGWNPASYARAVGEIQDMGYDRIALGGLVPLRSGEILEVLSAVSQVRQASTEIHLFGVTRCEHVPEFASYGVTSFDSTSPFRQAFQDATDNYYVTGGSYVALRVPQLEGNAKLSRRIKSGQIDQNEARKLEGEAMSALRRFEAGRLGVSKTVERLCEYQDLHDPRKDRSVDYATTLEAAPWRKCRCAVCKAAGIDVAIFRGTERNKRRGFHNLYVFEQRLKRRRTTSRHRQASATKVAA